MMKKTVIYVISIISVLILSFVGHNIFKLQIKDILGIDAILLSVISMFGNIIENALSYKPKLCINDAHIEGKKANDPVELYDADFVINITNIGEKVAEDIELNFEFDLDSFSKETCNLNSMYSIEKNDNEKFINYSFQYGEACSKIENNYKINYLFGGETVTFRLPSYISDLICLYLKSYIYDNKWGKFPVIKLNCKYKNFDNKKYSQSFWLCFDWNSASDIRFDGVIKVVQIK